MSESKLTLFLSIASVIAAVASAISAYFVWRLTNEQTEVAIRNQLPIFQYSMVSASQGAAVPSEIRIDVTDEGMAPAKIASFAIAWIAAKTPPSTPDWSNKRLSLFRPEKLIVERSGKSVSSVFPIKLSGQELAAIGDRGASLWVYGYFCYREYYNPLIGKQQRLLLHKACEQDNGTYDDELKEYPVAKRFDPATNAFVDDPAFAESHAYIVK